MTLNCATRYNGKPFEDPTDEYFAVVGRINQVKYSPYKRKIWNIYTDAEKTRKKNKIESRGDKEGRESRKRFSKRKEKLAAIFDQNQTWRPF